MKRFFVGLSAGLALTASANGMKATADTSVVTGSDPKSLSLSFPVTKYSLPNGLTVLLLEDHRVPMISYHTWYRVGSRDEREGITGSAHMMEHMMFQGAKKYDAKAFAKLMQDNGIEFNAFTSYDQTGFYMDLPASKLKLVMEAEKDRMSSLSLDPKNLTSEKEVVKEERRWRTDNKPAGQLLELLDSTVFAKSAYHWPVIGWMKDIEAFDVPTLRAFYEADYVARNAVLVLVGDFDTERVKKMIAATYGGLPDRPAPARTFTPEPPQTQPREARLKKNVQQISFYVAFQGTPDLHPDMYALDLAATVLGAGSSSRLYKALVYDRQIASGVSVGHSCMQHVGIFDVSVTLKPGQALAPALTVVQNELARLRDQPLSAEELAKARTITVKGAVDELQTADSRARLLASAEILTGSYENLLHIFESYNRVTPADVQDAARRYLRSNQRSLVVLEPGGGVKK